MDWAGRGEPMRRWCSAGIAVGVKRRGMSAGADPLPVMLVTDGEGEG